MQRRSSIYLGVFLCSLMFVAPVVGQINKPPSYDESRLAGWLLTASLLESLEQGDVKEWPGTRAWLKDLREQTKGIGEEIPVAKWPKVDIGALVDRNPNFWRMYFEVAPADPTLTLIHAGLLLSQGEGMRAAYLLSLGEHRPGIPRKLGRAFGMLRNTAVASLSAGNALTQEGIQLFDKEDYDGAIKKLREALAICPTNGWTYYELGYTLRTKAVVARGERPPKVGITINKPSNDTPEVTAAFTEARSHDPLGYMAYQGSDPDVIKGFKAIGERIIPGFKTLGGAGLTKDTEYHALDDVSKGFAEAQIYDLAIFARQLMVARRNSYDADDYPILAAALRKSAPGASTEELLKQLAGKTMKFRALTKLDQEEGQPALGSGERLYMPDKPAKVDPNNPVQMDFIRLLTGENDIAGRTTVEDLTKFTLAFRKIADGILAQYDVPCKVLVRFKCTPAGHTVEVLRQPEKLDEKPLQELHAALGKLEKLPVKEQAIEFEVQLSVTPKGKAGDQAE